MSKPSVFLKRDKELRVKVNRYSSFAPYDIDNNLRFKDLEFTPCGEPEGQRSEYFEKLRHYFLEQKESDTGLHFPSMMTPHLGSLPDGKITFYMGINPPFINQICSILPSLSPFIQIKGSLEYKFPFKYPEGTYLFDNCFQLEDLVKNAEKRRNSRIRPRISFSTEEPDVSSDEHDPDENTVALIIKYDVILGWCGIDHSGIKLRSSSVLQNVFAMDSFKDVTIVAGDGTELMCHRNIIAVHSPVMAAMLSPENGMVEHQTGRIEMPENSKQGIHQLIRYLYGFEISNAELANVAVELFKTAHMYQLSQLEKHLADLIINKGTEWFSLGDILELYFYVKNIDLLATFRCHLLRIMISMNRELRACEVYKGLNPEQQNSLILDLFDAK